MNDVPRYDMRRLIATGGMGKVWAAHDTVLDRDVAVKVLKDEYADDAHFRERFAAEARHAARLQHPNVAAVLDYGELPATEEHPKPRPYLVMELVEGEPLSALIEPDRPMPAETAVDILSQAATGIAAAHRAGIVHRDVKPGNLMVTPSGTVKVTDFGIARAADGVALTVTGHVMGTPHYLSPEQAEGKTASPASDVYGLGIVLFECLAGRRPFSGESAVATALQQIHEPLPPLPDDVPAWLRSVVQRATAKDPAERFTDAGELAGALKKGQPQEVPGAATRQLTAVGLASPATRRTARAPAAGPSRRRRRVAWWPLIGLLAALVIGGLLVWGLLNADDDPGDTGTGQVQVDPDDYVGLPYDDAAADLEDAGLDPTREERDNPGGEDPETVASVRPTGSVDEGSEVVLTVWGAEPEQEPEPAQPTSESTPTTEESPTDNSGPGNNNSGGNDNGNGDNSNGDNSGPGSGGTDDGGVLGGGG